MVIGRPWRDIFINGLEYMSRRFLYSLSLAYILLPSLIFLLSWVTAWVGIPIAAGCMAASVWMLRRVGGVVPSCSRMTAVCIVAAIALWALVAGVGGFVWQNRWDHAYRNAVFMDLVRYPWPVVNDGEMLVYYLGFWLPPALVAKALGSFVAGYVAQWLYAVIGIVLGMWLTFDAVGRVKWRIVAVVMFAGTLDIVGYAAVGGHGGVGDVLPNWNWVAYIEWPDVMIYWVYNQFIPSWVGVMLMLRMRGGAVSALVMGLLLVSAPFPVVGMFPVAIYFLWRDMSAADGWYHRVVLLLNPFNILALALAVVVGTYFTGNYSAAMFRLQDFSSAESSALFFVRQVAALVLGVGVWLPFVWKRVTRDPVFWALALFYIGCMFFVMGLGRDFASRTVLPLCYYLIVRLSESVCEWKFMRRSVRIAFCCVAALGACSVADELKRIAYFTALAPSGQWRNVSLYSVFEEYPLRENFVGDAGAWPFIRQCGAASVKDYGECGEPYCNAPLDKSVVQ